LVCARGIHGFKCYSILGEPSEADGSELGKTPALAGDGRFLIGTARADEVID
jgi:hypothetical protein